MKSSLAWLKDHLDLSELSSEELSSLLTFSGIEVEGIEQRGIPSPLIVVAQIKEAEQHPNADKLKVCQVDVGEKELRQIVCGAKNYSVGDKVPCALPGADLGRGFIIKEGKLRGTASNGMLCAASEIGLVDQEDGLLILPADSTIGQPLVELHSSDTVFELEVTPNRPDSLCHRGVARELSVLAKRDLITLPEVSSETTPSEDMQLLSGTCPFYSATIIKGVKVGPSPAWLQQKLEAIGLAPINNIVDITNYVLHDLGQPLHAFDAAKVSAPLVIRNSPGGEVFRALDENDYTLLTEDCVISDQAGNALALGGIMGGLESGVTYSTTDIILEAAWFTPSEIRRTSRRLNLSSDSSYRFERQTDPALVLLAAARAIQLILELAGGKAETTQVAGTCPDLTRTISFSLEQLNQVSADSISKEEAIDCLQRLGLSQGSEEGVWQIPSSRPDLTRPIDLVEEVVRVIGFDRIPNSSAGHFVPSSASDKIYDEELALKKHLAALGFYECQTIKLIAPSQLEQCLPLKPLQDADLISVALPLSEEQSLMRPSLAPGLIASAAHNVHQGTQSLRLFEAGNCFRHLGGGKKKDQEFPTLALLLAGPQDPASWKTPQPQGTDLFDLKGILQSFLPNLPLSLKPKDLPGYLLSATVHFGDANLGVLGRLAPAQCRALDLPLETHLAELDLKKLATLRSTPRVIAELPQFPGSSRDAALELPLEHPASAVADAIAKFKEPLLVSSRCISLFSDPSGEKIAADKKSLAYSFLYRSGEKTLKAKDVDATHQRLLAHLTNSLPVTFR